MASEFIKNTSKLLAGNTIGQIVAIIAIPIITRLYSVEAYGIFSVIIAIGLILAPFSSLSMHLAILISASEYEAKKVLKLSVLLTVSFSVLLLILCLVFENTIITLLKIDDFTWAIYTIPVIVLVQNTYTILSYWGVRVNSINSVSISKITEGISDRVIAIGFAILGYVNVSSLIIAKVFASILALTHLLPTLITHKTEVDRSEYSYIELLKRYVSYIKFNMPSMMIVNCAIQLPVILIAAYFSAELAGLYAIANRIVNIPVAVLGNAISKTFTKKIASHYSKGESNELEKSSKSFYNLLFSYLLIPFTALLVAGEPLLNIILGVKWKGAGEMVAILSYLAMTMLLTQAFSGIFDVYEKQAIRLKFHILNFIIRFFSLALCIYMGFEFIDTLIIFTVVSIFLNFYALYLQFSCIKPGGEIFEPLRDNAHYVLLYIALSTAVYLCGQGLIITLTTVFTLTCLWFVKVGGLNRLKDFT